MKFLKFLVAALFLFSIDAVAYNSLSLKFNIAGTPTDANISIEQQGNKIVATSSADIVSMRLYTIDAAVVAKSSNNIIETGSLSEGVYLVRVSTVEGSKNIKLYIQK